MSSLEIVYFGELWAVFGTPTPNSGKSPLPHPVIDLCPCSAVICSCSMCLSSVVVEELDISDVRYSRIARNRITEFHAVRPALILFLTPLIFLPVPVALGTEV